VGFPPPPFFVLSFLLMESLIGGVGVFFFVMFGVFGTFAARITGLFLVASAVAVAADTSTACGPPPNRTLDIGVLAYHRAHLTATRMYVEGVNARCDGVMGYTLRAHVCDATTTTVLTDAIAACVRAMPRVDVMLSLRALASDEIERASTELGVALVDGAVQTPASRAFDSFLERMRMTAYASVAIVAERAHEDACVHAVANANFAESSMRVVYDARVNVTGDGGGAAANDVVRAFRDAPSADILLTCLADCDAMWTALRVTDWNPRGAHATLLCATRADTHPDATFAFHAVQWSEHVRGEAYRDVESRAYGNLFPPRDNQTSAQRFAAAYRRSAGADDPNDDPNADDDEALAEAAAQMASLYRFEFAVRAVMQNASSSASSSSPSTPLNVPLLRIVLRTAEFDCLFGVVRGECTRRPMSLTQRMPNANGDGGGGGGGGGDIARHVMDPAQATCVLPTPTLTERVYAPAPFTHVIERVALGTAALLTACAIALGAALVTRRDTRAMRPAQSFLFSACFLCGCVALAWAPFTYAIVATRAQCVARLPVFLLAFVGIVGPVSITVRRIRTILERTTFVTARVSDARLLCHMLMCHSWQLLGVALALVLGAYDDEMAPRVFVLDAYRPSYNRTVCVSRRARLTYLAYAILPSLAWNLAHTCHVAYRIRRRATPMLHTNLVVFHNAGRLVSLVFHIATACASGIALQFLAGHYDVPRAVHLALMALLSHVLAGTCMVLHFHDAFPCAAAAGKGGAVGDQRALSATLSSPFSCPIRSPPRISLPTSPTSPIQTLAVMPTYFKFPRVARVARVASGGGVTRFRVISPESTTAMVLAMAASSSEVVVVDAGTRVKPRRYAFSLARNSHGARAPIAYRRATSPLPASAAPAPTAPTAPTATTAPPTPATSPQTPRLMLY
jgi:hypothetical protein